VEPKIPASLSISPDFLVQAVRYAPLCWPTVAQMHDSIQRENQRAVRNAESFCDARGGRDNADSFYRFPKFKAVGVGQITDARHGVLKARK
jgi:hypothetical protein